MQKQTTIMLLSIILIVILVNQEAKAEFPISTQIADQRLPAIDSNIVVWQDYRDGNGDIYGYDFDTETEFAICTAIDDQDNPDIDGNIVVWGDSRDGNGDIYGYNLETETEFPICTDSNSQSHPTLDSKPNCSLFMFNNLWTSVRISFTYTRLRYLG